MLVRILSFNLLLLPVLSFAWGFWSHKHINKMAITTLPPDLAFFYKRHSVWIEKWAVLPDQRRYAVEGEACKHYIDFEAYDTVPKFYKDAVRLFSEDTLTKHGILPWNIQWTYERLVKAFVAKDIRQIVKLSAELGHYIADAHVPLHTTSNYNGQLTNQHGIHGLWETRLPELFHEQYFYYTGSAQFIQDIPSFAQNLVYSTHSKVKQVLQLDSIVRSKMPDYQWYEIEMKGGSAIKTYSRKYAKLYHKLLDGMVEQQMKASIKSVGSVWYTAWIEAGQPELQNLPLVYEEEEESHSNLEECKH